MHRGSGSVVVDAQRLWEAAQRLCDGGGGAGDGGGILGPIGCIGLLNVWLESFGTCKLLGDILGLIGRISLLPLCGWKP